MLYHRQYNSTWPLTSNIVFGFEKCNWFSFSLTHSRYVPPYQPPVIFYIVNSYSQLLAFITTKHWSTSDDFKIERGVFQGDALSPLIFLISFNPLIEMCN